MDIRLLGECPAHTNICKNTSFDLAMAKANTV